MPMKVLNCGGEARDAPIRWPLVRSCCSGCFGRPSDVTITLLRSYLAMSCAVEQRRRDTFGPGVSEAMHPDGAAPQVVRPYR